MHEIAAPAYLRYEADVTTTISGSGAIRKLLAHVERTNPFDDAKVLASITLDIDTDGYIGHYVTTMTGRSFFSGTTTVEQEGTYRSREPADASAWSTATTGRS